MARWSRDEIDALKERIRRIDPELLVAAKEVDPALRDYALTLTPLERLALGTRSAHGMSRFRRGPSS